MRVMRYAAAVLVLFAAGAVLGPRSTEVEAAAGPLAFTAIINGAQEVPPVTTSPYYGVGYVTYDKADNEMCWGFNHNVPDGDTTAAHMHFGPVGVDGPVEIDLLDADNPMASCTTPNSDQVKALKKGLLYVNVHTTAFELGEIRGQIYKLG